MSISAYTGSFLASKYQNLSDIRICCSYEELLRFKASAALAASNKMQLTGIQSSYMGLLQAIADNFVANITSPNGLESTHALALLMTQVGPNTEDGQEDTSIKRLKKEYVKDSTPSGIPISYFHGPKSPEMPEEVVKEMCSSSQTVSTTKNTSSKIKVS